VRTPKWFLNKNVSLVFFCRTALRDTVSELFQKITWQKREKSVINLKAY